LDLSALSKSLPGFWSVMSKTRGGIESEGIYDWIEPDNSTRKKYMYISIVDVKTADNVGFSVAATTYMDEFSFPLKNLNVTLQESLAQNSKDAESYYKKIILVIFFSSAFFIVILFGASFYLTKAITNPLKKLYDSTLKLEKGDFKTRVDIKSGDEFEELGNEFNRTTEALERIDEERKQIDKIKTEFLSITSHELRSPMTPMRAQLQMLLENYFGKLNPKQKESLDVVLRNTERLDKIIVDFLEISRIEAARLKFDFKKVDLVKTINSIVEEMKGFMPEKKIKIEVEMEKFPIIEADSDRFGQVLRNLINNAIKFTPEKGVVKVKGKLSEGMILFSVSDSGIGIADKDQKRIFEPFYQVENMYQHKSGGTGLGLAICKGIVESQNGKIWMESKPNVGTTFYFTLPLSGMKAKKGEVTLAK